MIVWGNQRVIRQGQGEGRRDAGMARGHDVSEQSHLMISMAQCRLLHLCQKVTRFYFQHTSRYIHQWKIRT
jgi:hypothetical protein